MATALQYGDEIALSVPREDASIRGLAKLFFATFWFITFTGAIRKWLFPGVTALYLLQDVPIGLAYLYALRKGVYDRGFMLFGIVLLGGVLTLQGLLQIIIVGVNPFVTFVGFHNYIFYLPMLLVFPICLREQYRRNFIRLYLLSSIPMCALAVAQAESPLNAWVNRTSEGDAFGVPGAADVARVSGTFNFVYFYGLWVGTGVALCLGEWLLPRQRRVFKSPWLLALCTFAINICHMVSASRQTIIYAVIALVGGLVCAFIVGSVRSIATIAGIMLLLPVAASLTYVISPAEFNIVVDRFTGKHYQENGAERIGISLFGFLTEPRFDLVGAGIGMGVDASHVGSANAYTATYDLSETDTVRNVMELGTPVGLLYVCTRLFFALGMILLSVRIVRSGSLPHALPLSFFLFANAYLGDMTRAATMTATQTLLGYSFILSVLFYPDRAAISNVALETNPMRYA